MFEYYDLTLTQIEFQNINIFNTLQTVTVDIFTLLPTLLTCILYNLQLYMYIENPVQMASFLAYRRRQRKPLIQGSSLGGQTWKRNPPTQHRAPN